MELWIEKLLWALGGWSIGVIAGIAMGTLRVDRSMPDEAPSIFLELEPGGFDDLYKEKTVNLKVNLNSYLPRK